MGKVGLLAPMIFSAERSIPSLAFSVAATSISVNSSVASGELRR
jgi:hypothetical protein